MFTDIHSHCLPEVDDGSKSLVESLKMVEQYWDNKFRSVIATPHFHYKRGHASGERIMQEAQSLTAALQRNYPEFRIYTGNEIYYSHNVPDLLREKKALTLAGSRYALIEFEPQERFAQVRSGLYEVMQAGFYPVLAHGERIMALQEDIRRMDELVDMGVYIQVNIRSVKSESNFRQRRFLKEAIRTGLVHFLATDSHSSGRRNPQVEQELYYIERKFGGDFLEQVLEINPGKVIAHEVI